MDNNQFKGRKGQKRLKELNERIDSILKQTDDHAAKSPSMELIMRSIPDPLVKEYFVERYRSLDHYWAGMQTIGFLRLCEGWIRRKKLTTLEQQNIDEMFMDILPAEAMQRVRNVKIQQEPSGKRK